MRTYTLYGIDELKGRSLNRAVKEVKDYARATDMGFDENGSLKHF